MRELILLLVLAGVAYWMTTLGEEETGPDTLVGFSGELAPRVAVWENAMQHTRGLGVPLQAFQSSPLVQTLPLKSKGRRGDLGVWYGMSMEPVGWLAVAGSEANIVAAELLLMIYRGSFGMPDKEGLATAKQIVTQLLATALPETPPEPALDWLEAFTKREAKPVRFDAGSAWVELEEGSLGDNFLLKIVAK